MVITRCKARSRQILDCEASPWANPSASASAWNQNTPQQLSQERGVSSSTQDPGGRLTTSLAAGNKRQPGVHKCREDCLSCPDLSHFLDVKSNVTGRIYSSINIKYYEIIVKLGTIFISLPAKVAVCNMSVKVLHQ